MGRCYACCQENCGYGKCDCGCHVEDDKPATPAPVPKPDPKTESPIGHGWSPYPTGGSK